MNEELARIARNQHGLVSRAQALAELKRHQIKHRLRSGELELVRKGVYRVLGAPLSWEQSVLGACLAVPGAAASFRCAAALYGFDGFPCDGIEITVGARSRRRLEGVVVHDSAVVGPLHRSVVHGIPATSVARTLCDLTAVEHARVVERAVDEALRRKMLKLRTLAHVSQNLEGRGRRRCTVMRAILDARAPGYEPGDSNPEARIARLLVLAGLPAPTLQHRVRVGRRTLRIDLCYPEAKIAIEYDGWDFHSSRTAFDDDRARANELVLLGYSVLRFTSRSTDDAIVETVAGALSRACVV